MALAQAASGTQAAVVGVANTLATITTGKTCVLYVDLRALAAGDTVELRVEEKVLAAETAARVNMVTFAGVQADPIAMSLPYAAVHSVAFILTQTTGLARTYPWSVRTLD